MKALDVFEAPFNGFSLVEASAGTGKTYNITSLYIRAIVEKKLMPANILVLTYTEAATAELKSRIKIRIQECIEFLSGSLKDEDDEFLNGLRKNYDSNSLPLLKNALFSFDESSIFTIHGFCQKLLRENSLAFGVQPDFEILQDTSELIQDAVDSFWRDYISKHSESDIGRSKIEFLLKEKIEPDKLLLVIERIIAKPYAKILPSEEVKEIAESKTKLIEELFGKLKSQWNKDKTSLKETIYSGKLYKSTYKVEEPEVLNTIWKNLESWIANPGTPLTGFDKLDIFGAEKIESKTTKGNQVYIPVFSHLLDEFLEEISNLNALKASFFQEAIEESKAIITFQKEKKNALSFDDLLQKVEASLNSELSQKIASQYPLALVDEFQDTDPIQYSIFKQIYSENGSLFMIGDPKQAIYSFRGADLFTYFEAIHDVQNKQRYSLDYNYRSSEELISAVNAVFNSHESPFVFDEPNYRDAKFPKDKAQRVLTLNGEKQNPLTFIDCSLEDANKDVSKKEVRKFIAKKVKQLLIDDYKIGESKVHSKDISILVRTKQEALEVQQSLSEVGIKSIARSKDSIFQTDECDELQLILKAILDYSNHDLLRAALVTKLIGYSSDKITEIKNSEVEWSKIVQVFRNASEAWESQGVLKSLQHIDQFFQIRLNLSRQKEAERKITNLNHLEELISSQESKQQTSPHSIIRFINQKKSSTSSPGDEELIRLESDRELVTITTLHSSKGLEYPIVFIPFLWDEFERKNYQQINLQEFHNEDNILTIDLLPTKNGDSENQARKEALADTLRLSYVALTRAEVACYIPFVKYKGITNSALFAMLSGPEQLLASKLNQSKLLDQFQEDLSLLCENDFVELRDSKSLLGQVDKREPSVVQGALFDQANYSCKAFSRTDIGSISRIVSFSSLSSTQEQTDQAKDYDQLDFSSKTQEDEQETLSRFTFPKGAGTGNLLHNIFEKINFQNSSDHLAVIEDEFKTSGLDKKWFSLLEPWISEGLNHHLTKGLKLADLSQRDVLKEMEFHFPVSDINFHRIVKIIRGVEPSLDLNRSISGFMKGFIDLVFRQDGKYYILDYKSNHLGDSLNDYNSERLSHKIRSSNFDVQYHIYSLALKLYLEQRVTNFNFQKDFGGVFYLFLRGIDKNTKESGVYFDKPSLETVEDLESILGMVVND